MGMGLLSRSRFGEREAALDRDLSFVVKYWPYEKPDGGSPAFPLRLEKEDDMIRALLVALLAFLAVSSLGCMVAPVVPPTALLYTGFEAPLDVDFEDQTHLGSKKGEASTMNVLGLVSWGDASSASAAQDGNVQTIRHADYRFTSVLGIFSRYTTIVYGD